MWTRLATVIAREGSDSFPQNWIFERMRIISEKYLQHNTQIRTMLAIPKNVSEWDCRMIDKSAQTVNDLITTISLIMFYNSFAEIWTETLNNVEFQKLCELYNLGKKLASTEMKGVRISFPGVWQYDFDEYIEARSR